MGIGERTRRVMQNMVLRRNRLEARRIFIMYSSSLSLKPINEAVGNLKTMENGERTDEKDTIRRNVGRYDKKLLRWLVDFYSTISGETIDMDKVTDLVEILEKIKKSSSNLYLHDLIYPEYARNAKIPLEFPIPTSSYQIHNQLTLSTNATGNLAIIFNPFYLEQGATTNSNFYFNNAATLTGAASDGNFISTNIGTTIPVEVYQNYRLVSAAIHIRYVYRLDAASGVFGGSVNFEGIGQTAIGVANANLARYGNFNYIDDSYFSQRGNVLDGLRLVYVPYDNSVQEFQQLGTYRAGCNFLLYCQSFPPSASCIRVDVFLNYESTLDPVFQNYVPTGFAPRGTKENMKDSVEFLTQRNMVSSTLTNYESVPSAEKSKMLFIDPTEEKKNHWFTDAGSTLGSYYEEFKKYLPSIKEIGSLLMGTFI